MRALIIAGAALLILLEFVAFLLWLRCESKLRYQQSDTPLEEEPPRDQTRYWYILKEQGKVQ